MNPNYLPSTARCVVWTLALATLALARSLAAYEPVQGPLVEAGFTGYVQQQQLEYEPLQRWPGVQARTLSQDHATGRLAVYAGFPAGFTVQNLAASEQSIDFILLDGDLQWGDTTLKPYDFAFLPPGVSPPALQSESGAHALVFFDPAVQDALVVERQRARGAYVSSFDPARWEPAALAKSAGATIDLQIMHLKRDPDTSARSWYVKLDGDMTVPWEIHSMPEEGYVMEGGYRLAECLPARTVFGEYHQGGYFWRPGGVPHSGPESGPVGKVMWLQRSPVSLDVVFYHDCADGVATGPVLGH